MDRTEERLLTLEHQVKELIAIATDHQKAQKATALALGQTAETIKGVASETIDISTSMVSELTWILANTFRKLGQDGSIDLNTLILELEQQYEQKEKRLVEKAKDPKALALAEQFVRALRADSMSRF